MSQQTTPGQKLDNLAFNRNLVLWSHITQKREQAQCKIVFHSHEPNSSKIL
jgi:hypothetical protein